MSFCVTGMPTKKNKYKKFQLVDKLFLCYCADYHSSAYADLNAGETSTYRPTTLFIVGSRPATECIESGNSQNRASIMK